MNYLIFYGSVRTSRQGIKAAKFIENKLKARGHNTHLADPLDYNLPLLDKMYSEYKENTAPDNLEKLAKHIKNADGYVVVSGEYNHSIPPALTNMMDYFLREYLWRPSAIVCYSAGPFGGVRAAMQLRSYLCEIGTPSISSLFPISAVQSSFSESGEDISENKRYQKNINKFLDELDWFANAFKTQRAQGTPY